jgi:hypothetical protein
LRSGINAFRAGGHGCRVDPRRLIASYGTMSKTTLPIRPVNGNGDLAA